MTLVRGALRGLSEEHREALAGAARRVVFPPGARIFEQGGAADRFWVIRSGAVALDLHVPGRRPAVVETLGRDDLLGWSWMLAPFRWRFGARAADCPVEADEYDAVAVRDLCARDPLLRADLACAVASVVAHRLTASRHRLLELYGPQGSGAER